MFYQKVVNVNNGTYAFAKFSFKKPYRLFRAIIVASGVIDNDTEHIFFIVVSKEVASTNPETPGYIDMDKIFLNIDAAGESFVDSIRKDFNYHPKGRLINDSTLFLGLFNNSGGAIKCLCICEVEED